MLEPGQKERLQLTAPKEPGTYEYVCTSPGHWVIRWVRLIATADIDALLQANVLATPAAPAASSPQQH
jgi:hypothetical protein